MRWRVHGSDASSGSSVLLDVEADNAVAAVAHAHDRDIVVLRVVRAGRERLRRVAPFLLAVAAVTLGMATVVLDHQLGEARRAAADTTQSSSATLADLQAAKGQLADAAARVAFLEGTMSQRERELDALVGDLKTRLSTAQTAAQQLNKTGQDAATRITTLTTQVNALTTELAAAQGARKSLESTLAEVRRQADKHAADAKASASRAKQADSRLAALDARVADMAAQLKTAEQQSQQLRMQLEQVRSEKASEPAPARYALAISYDEALDFVSLHLGKPTIERHRGLTRVSAAHVERANTFSLTTDKERVFEATLHVCLAGDAPKAALAQNRETLAKFAAAFAPQWKTPLPWLEAQFRHLAGKDDAEHAMLTTEHYRVTVTPNKLGQFGVRIEPHQQ